MTYIQDIKTRVKVPVHFYKPILKELYPLLINKEVEFSEEELQMLMALTIRQKVEGKMGPLLLEILEVISFRLTTLN